MTVNREWINFFKWSDAEDQFEPTLYIGLFISSILPNRHLSLAWIRCKRIGPQGIVYHAVCVSKVSVRYPRPNKWWAKEKVWELGNRKWRPNSFSQSVSGGSTHCTVGCRHHKRLFQEVVVIKLNETNLYSQGICCDRPKPKKTAVFHLYQFSIPSLWLAYHKEKVKVLERLIS